ncbi:MAG: hypothetical protein ACI4E1_11430 [Lachnospira sp.]
MSKIANLIRRGIGKIKTCCAYLYHLFEGREKHISYGRENKDKVFYVVGQDDFGGGLFWIVNKAIMHIAYAVEKGWVPVVDYKTHKTQYTLDKTCPCANFWELFFEQPCGYSLDDINRSRYIVLQKKSPAPKKYYLMGQTEFYDDKDRILYFRNYFKRYIRFNEATSTYLNDKYHQLFINKGPIVGVLCRGTDYVIKRPKGHFVQPDPNMMIEDVLKIQKQFGCKYVFLATEDADIFQNFVDVFGERLLSIPQKRISKSNMDKEHFLSTQSDWIENDHPIEKARAYLTSMYLLSRCDCFLSGRTGGAKAVLLMTNGFRYQKIYNLGFY